VSDAEVFEAHRDLMFAVAYRIPGSVADAEDAVQDAWLRWSAEPRSDMANLRAYLSRIIANTALNRLRSARAPGGLRRPVAARAAADRGRPGRGGAGRAGRVGVGGHAGGAGAADPRGAHGLVLREVFGFSHAEIGGALGRSPAAVRQLAHRAREHVQARRPRFDVDWNQQREVTERFLAAAAGGDIDGLMTVLAPDVTLLTDGGGKARAALRPITGAAKVAGFVAAIAGRPYMGVDIADMSLATAEINGSPGTLIADGRRPIAALTLAVADRRVTAIQLVTNPDKLTAIAAGRTLPSITR
jgi:DNA-directed RNA polymerase specialized sigma24 family protein